ncbi:flagellar hook-length control protein FliK [Mesobacillus subterraneus]|uniref:flagellar hook-length control protein FliK n=1 Tax=Mesobacillus subterraneus TaxID=285983 RepID=UPI00204021E4|nr:flagellar hook-length control protein FliK [Mesobacillus subterraneus]MCM3572771.1 flagellar hook-length control protein FliK [Mesobacillus subterraneus]
MEIGGLGFFNTIAAGKQPVADKTGKDGSFAGLMSTVLSGKTNSPAATEASKDGEKLEELGSLAELINVSDLLELEDGMKLLDMLNSDSGSLLNKALSQLGINNEELKLFIQKWSSADGVELTNASDEELLASIAALLTGIANQPADELTMKLDQSDVQALKALKLYELMSRYADGQNFKNSDSIKESLKSLGEALKDFLGTNNNNSNTDYLQKRFTQLAVDLNLASKKLFTEGNGFADPSSGLKTEGAPGTLGFLPQMTKAEQLMLTMNSPERPVSAEQLMKQFESILSKSHFMNSGGTQKLFIKLFPEHLGSIRIELFQRDLTMMARIITTSGTAKETLESQINGLKQAFAAQNLSVDRIEVTQQQAQQERFLNKDSEQQQRHSDRGQQEQKDEKGDFNLSFEEALLNTEA